METEFLTKALAILHTWFQFTESTVIDSVVVATSCTAKKDLMPYFKKGQVFEQVSLDTDNIDVILEKSKGVQTARVGLGHMYLYE